MCRKIDWKVQSPTYPFSRCIQFVISLFNQCGIFVIIDELILTCYYCELLKPVVDIQVHCLVHSVGLDKSMTCVCDHCPLHNSFTACAPPVSLPLISGDH